MLPTAVGSNKRNSNHGQPTYVQTASPSPLANLESDVTSAASIGENDSDSDYVKSAENSPTSPANTPDLTGHISEPEEMHEVAGYYIGTIALPTVIFSRIDDLEIPELNDAETNPPENHQDNGAMPPVNTQPSLSHSPPE